MLDAIFISKQSDLNPRFYSEGLTKFLINSI